MNILRITTSIVRAFILVVLTCVVSFGQLPLGTWQSHLPHKVGLRVTESPQHIIYSTGLDLIFIEKENFSVRYLSTIDGLAGTDIIDIHYDSTNDQLLIIYADSGIDLLQQDGTIYHLSNIKDNTSIASDKRVNAIHIGDDGIIYFATGFGLVELDGAEFSFGATVITDLPVTDVITYHGVISISTTEGLYQIDDKDGLNRSDFSQWSYLSDGQYGLPSLTKVDAVSTLDGHRIVVIKNKIYRASADSFRQWMDLPVGDLDFSFLEKSSERLILGYTDGQGRSKVFLVMPSGQYVEPTSDCLGIVTDALIDESERIWYGDEYRPIRYADAIDRDCRLLDYSSPYHQSVSDIAIKDGRVYVASGGVSDNYQYLFSREGFYIKDKNGWANFNEFSHSWIRDFDLLNIYKIYPTDERLYLCSYWAGLVEYDLESDQALLYNNQNSNLTGTIGDDARIRVTGVVEDDDKNLWVTTFGAAQGLHVRTSEGLWYSPSTIGRTTVTDVQIDDNGQLWCPIYSSSGGGVLLYDPGDDALSSGDDRQRLLRQSNSELPSDQVRCVISDRSGLVWIGTNRGPVVFDPRSDLFRTDNPGIRIKVVEDGIPAFLLADQDVRAIAVDGADRKWFGTTNGIFVQSPDGREKIARFTTDNSPLFDNLITDMAYDGETGIMYIGTARGLIAYQTLSTQPAKRHRSDQVLVYPNPVKGDHQGPIGITGLIEDAIVKITDVNGRLVYETRALGGHAIWEGVDTQGKKVPSGVYLIFSSNGNTSQSPDGYVAKVMVLR